MNTGNGYGSVSIDSEQQGFQIFGIWKVGIIIWV